VNEAEEITDHGAEIARRDRIRLLEGRLRKLTMAVVGLMAYSAFGNFVGGIAALATLPWDGGLGLVLGSLYLLGIYQVWSKDDIRWWPVAVPAGISITVLLLAWFGGFQRPFVLLLNVVLLILVPIRARVSIDLAAALNSSFKPTSDGG
jgi:hypothetical protein